MSGRLGRAASCAALIGLGACHSMPKTTPPDAGPTQTGPADAGPNAVHSSTLALSADGSRLYVVNADSDSVSVVDPVGRSLISEILLAPSAPSLDSDGGYTPAVMPRSLALSPDGKTLYVIGERSGALHVIDVGSSQVTGTVALGSEPISVVVSFDGASIFATCSMDATVVKVDAKTLQVTGSLQTAPKPWALALLPDGTLLTTNFLSAEVTAIDSAAMSLKGTYPIPDTQPRSDPRLAYGKARGLYDVAARPGSDELWVAHLQLATNTAQPTLDFETTAFATLTVMHSTGVLETRLSVNAQDVPGINGAFADVVSGPHALAFTSDGDFALVVDTNSEDVLVVDAHTRLESSMVRPLPGHMPEGIVLSPDGTHAYVDERNTSDIAVIDVSRSDGGIFLQVDGTPIARQAADPMPTELRLGQHLFYSANSDEYRITTNHWISCATCHLEGRSDAVTWRFLQGPRDTPSNAGGALHTGFLLRTADMRTIQDYFRIINTELGGHFPGTDPTQAPLLDALADYVNHGIVYPIPPTTDPVKVARGQVLFNDSTVGCARCHAGAYFTDSAAGNPDLALDGGVTEFEMDGGVILHNINTCVVALLDGGGPYPDVAHLDVWGDLRDGCSYDTPSLRGIADSFPYLHDGRAATLHDVLEMTRGSMGDITGLDGGDEDALVEYLRSL